MVLISSSFLLFFILLLFISIKYFRFKYNSFESAIKHKKQVIDIFTYFQESLMLSLRFFRMNDFVDIFLIIVANTTFSGKPLKISFSPFESFISKYREKIIFYNISHPSSCFSTWCREKYQRNAAYNALKSLNIYNESIVIISDLDEIPTSDGMKYILNNPPNSFYMLSGYM